MAFNFPSIEIDNVVRGTGMPVRRAVRLASSDFTAATLSFTAPVLTISGLPAGTTLAEIDGIEVAVDDRVLIKNAQDAIGGNAAFNGIYVVLGGTTSSLEFVRAPDLELGDEVRNITVWIEAGLQANTSYAGSGVVDDATSAITWLRYDVAGTLETARGGTGLESFTQNALLYASDANTLATLPAVNNGVLSTDVAGVPSIAATLPAELSIPRVANFSLNDAGSAFTLAAAGNTADRTLTLNTQDADRTLNLGGDLTVAGGDVSITSANPSNVVLPASGTLANQQYVLDRIGGISVLDPVLAASDTTYWQNNVSLSVAGTTLTVSGLVAGTTLAQLDGVEPAVNDRVLIKDAGAASVGANAQLNGVYDVLGGTTSTLELQRSADADDNTEIVNGVFVYAETGTANGGATFVVASGNPIIIGTDDILFDLFTRGQSFLPGLGLELNGNTLNIDARANSGLTFTAQQLDLDLSASAITGTLAVDNGGTGRTSVAQNALLAGAGTGALTEIASVVDAVLVTNATGVASFATTLPSVELTDPRINDTLQDLNSNAMIEFAATAGSVNYFQTRNAATGAAPRVSALGADTDVDLEFAVQNAGNFLLAGNAGNAAELRWFDDTTASTNYIAHSVISPVAASTTYAWPSAPASNGLVLSTATDGTLSWIQPSVQSIRLTLLSNRVLIGDTNLTEFSYLAWNNADFSSFATRTVVVYVLTGNRACEIDLFDGSVLGSITVPTNSDGIFTFTFTAPAADTLLRLRARRTNNGGDRPELFAAYVLLE